jgi:hypothetical protein
MSTASNRPSGRVESARPSPAGLPPSDNGSLPPPSSFGRQRAKVTAAYVADLATRLSTRDHAILRDLARVRVLTGNQLERLHFYDLGLTNRDRARRRVLNRLIAWCAVTTLARRVGGVRAGSNGLVYSLDTAGQRVLRLLDDRDELPVRRPWTPGAMFLTHTLAASELYVRLREAERAGRLELSAFLAEPASWQRTATLGTLKPDAYALVAYGDVEDAWWIEVDQATESRNTIRRKLSLYLLTAQAGVVGPHGVLPRVLVTVPDEQRLTAIRDIVADLGPMAERLMSVTLHNLAVDYVAEILHA